MRKSVLVLLLLAVMAVPAVRAQVAVPSLVPAAPRAVVPVTPQVGTPEAMAFVRTTIVPLNPGALQWGAPSRIGGGWIEGESQPPAPAAKSDRQRGQYGGARFAGERLSFALGVVHNDTDFATAQAKEDNVALALAFKGLENLAIGLGAEDNERRENDDIALLSTTISVDNRTFGASWKLGEHLFVGAAMGRDDARVDSGTPPSQHFKRDLLMAGVGLRGGGGLLWHLEYSVVDRANFRDRFGQSAHRGSQVRQATVEVGFWNLLFGYTAFNGTFEEPDGRDGDISGYTADAGIAPPIGITLTARHESNEYTAPDGQVYKGSVNSAGITWQF